MRRIVRLGQGEWLCGIDVLSLLVEGEADEHVSRLEDSSGALSQKDKHSSCRVRDIRSTRFSKSSLLASTIPSRFESLWVRSTLHISVSWREAATIFDSQREWEDSLHRLDRSHTPSEYWKSKLPLPVVCYMMTDDIRNACVSARYLRYRVLEYNCNYNCTVDTRM